MIGALDTSGITNSRSKRTRLRFGRAPGFNSNRRVDILDQRLTERSDKTVLVGQGRNDGLCSQ
jgi:hypothetical protein